MNTNTNEPYSTQKRFLISSCDPTVANRGREAGETLGSRKRMRIPGNESHVSGITHEDKNQDGGRRNTSCNFPTSKSNNVLSALYLSLSITDTKEKAGSHDVC